MKAIDCFTWFLFVMLLKKMGKKNGRSHLKKRRSNKEKKSTNTCITDLADCPWLWWDSDRPWDPDRPEFNKVSIKFVSTYWSQVISNWGWVLQTFSLLVGATWVSSGLHTAACRCFQVFWTPVSKDLLYALESYLLLSSLTRGRLFFPEPLPTEKNSIALFLVLKLFHLLLNSRFFLFHCWEAFIPDFKGNKGKIFLQKVYKK